MKKALEEIKSRWLIVNHELDSLRMDLDKADANHAVDQVRLKIRISTLARELQSLEEFYKTLGGK